jgi:hypothetical protein
LNQQTELVNSYICTNQRGVRSKQIMPSSSLRK